MKPFIFSLFFLIWFAFSGNAQTKPTPQVQPVPQVLTPTAPLPKSVEYPPAQDYNFTFYPAPKYAKYMERYLFDSLSRNMVLVPDSTKGDVPLVVEKKDGQIVIRDLGNISVPIYSANLKFVGVADDGKFSLVYQSGNDQNEMLIVNPVFGYVVVIYRKCFPVPGTDQKPGEKSAPEMCNFVIHYFGNVPFKSYKP